MLCSTIVLSLFAMAPFQDKVAQSQVAKASKAGESKSPVEKATPRKAAEGRSTQGTVSLKIGVVDWEVILANSRWIRALERDAQRDLLPHKKTMDELMGKRASLRQDLSLYTEGTTEYNETVVKLKIVEYSLQQEQTLMKGLMGQKLKEMTYAFNKTIEDKIASYARNKGFHLVLRKNSPSTMKNVPLGSKVQEQERNSVLYFAPSLDITKAIIEVLDAGIPVEADSQKAGKDGKAPAATGTKDAKTGSNK